MKIRIPVGTKLLIETNTYWFPIHAISTREVIVDTCVRGITTEPLTDEQRSDMGEAHSKTAFHVKVVCDFETVYVEDVEGDIEVTSWKATYLTYANIVLSSYNKT